MAVLNTALIAQTEAMLSLVTRRVLDGSGVTEPEWVALRIADHLSIAHIDDDLGAAVNDRAGVTNGLDTVAGLTRRGLLANDRVNEAHRETIAHIQQQLDAAISPLMAGLAPDDIEAANRVLRELLNRARVALGREPLGPPKR